MGYLPSLLRTICYCWNKGAWWNCFSWKVADKQSLLAFIFYQAVTLFFEAWSVCKGEKANLLLNCQFSRIKVFLFMLFFCVILSAGDTLSKPKWGNKLQIFSETAPPDPPAVFERAKLICQWLHLQTSQLFLSGLNSFVNGLYYSDSSLYAIILSNY